jgi:Arc-like DNA binding domain
MYICFMSPKIKKEDTSLVGVRLPVELRKALEKVAEDQQRTLSQEIIFRLRRSFKGDSEGSDK